ncbi:MAG: hypothetical protein QHI48_04360, partial [Bacteroidota bacterium]|nr:hypothetical protein [Bacteroidota bacterium]
NGILGYDLNAVEFAVRGGIPYAIDCMNPAPDCERHSITPAHFDWVVEAVARLAVDYATGVRAPARPFTLPATESPEETLNGGTARPDE